MSHLLLFFPLVLFVPHKVQLQVDLIHNSLLFETYSVCVLYNTKDVFEKLVQQIKCIFLYFIKVFPMGTKDHKNNCNCNLIKAHQETVIAFQWREAVMHMNLVIWEQLQQCDIWC